MDLSARFKERKLFLGAMIAYGLTFIVFLIHTIFDHVFYGYNVFVTIINVFDWLFDLLGVACLVFLIFAMLSGQLKKFLTIGFGAFAVTRLLMLIAEFVWVIYNSAENEFSYIVRDLLFLFEYFIRLLCCAAIALFFAALLMRLSFLKKVIPYTKKFWFLPIILCALPIVLGVLRYWINFFVYDLEYYTRYYFSVEDFFQIIWYFIRYIFHYYMFSQILATIAMVFICLQLRKLSGASKQKQAVSAAAAPAPARQAMPGQRPVYHQPQRQPAPGQQRPVYQPQRQPAPQYTQPAAQQSFPTDPDAGTNDALRRYKLLLDSGVITQADYEAKKRELGL